VVNVSALVTLNKDEIGKPVASVPDGLMDGVDQGLRRVLAL
jgi:mRNA interferase MazF